MSKQRSVPVLAILALTTALILTAGCVSSSTPAPAPPAPTPSQGSTASQPATSQPAPTAPAASQPAPAAPATEAQPEPITVTVGMMPPSVSNAGIYIAEELGYFKEEGITLELKSFPSGDAQAVPLASGDLMVGTGGPNAGLYNSAARGIATKIVADKGHSAAGFDWLQFVAPTDLVNSGQVTSIKDLTGRKIAVGGKGASGEVATVRNLEAVGIDAKDVELTVIPFPQMAAAIANKSIDTALVSESFLSNITGNGTGLIIGSSIDAYPNQQIATIFYSEKFIQDHPDVARRWMLAYVKGLRGYNDAFRKGINKQQIVDILIKHKAASSAEFLDRMNKVGLHPDGAINMESIQYDIDFYVRYGYVATAPKVEDVVDLSFVEYAVQQLGQYQP